MEFLTYILMLCLAFLGLIIGIILSNIAIEEISDISKYLRYFDILVIASIVFIIGYKINLVYSIILTLTIIITLLILKNNNDQKWVYPSMGALFYIASTNNTLLNVTVLIFIYGISIATMQVHTEIKERKIVSLRMKHNKAIMKKVLSKNYLFLIVGLLFYIIFNIIRNI